MAAKPKSDVIFDQLDELVLADDLPEVERVAMRAVRGAPAESARDLWAYVAFARFELGQTRAAVTAAQKAHDPLLLAKAHFHLWEFDEAARLLDGISADGASAGGVSGDRDDEAEAAWYRGVLMEFSGRDGAQEFKRAARLAPDLFSLPVPMADGEIEAVFRQTLRSLPPEIREFANETVVVIRALPLPHPDVDPLSLGLYVGRDLLSRWPEMSGELPPHIEVFHKNIERTAHNRDEVIAELRITLLHELGHHLGFDESGVAEMGLG